MRSLISRITSRFQPAKPAQESSNVRVYPSFQVNRVRAVCKHCRKPIFLQGPNSEWRHEDELNFFACYPDAIVSSEAEPDPDAAPSVPAPRVPTTRCRHCKEPIRESGGEWRHYRAMIPDVRDCDWVDPLHAWTVAESMADDTEDGAGPAFRPVLVGDIRQGVTYTDRGWTSWWWEGETCDGTEAGPDGKPILVPVLQHANGSVRADWVIKDWGPLRATPSTTTDGGANHG